MAECSCSTFKAKDKRSNPNHKGETMKAEEIVKALTDKGYQANTEVINKYGVEKEVISVRDGSNIGIHLSIKNMENAPIEAIFETVENAFNNKPDIGGIFDPSQFLKNLRIALQPAGSADVVKMNVGYDGVEAYMHEIVDGGTIKVTKQLLEVCGIDEPEAWKIAQLNSFEETVIQDFNKIMTQVTGIEDESCPMWIIRNKSEFRGASAILNKEAIKKFAESIGVSKFKVIPSSVHECLLIPAGLVEDQGLLDLIIQTNKDTVLPEDFLANSLWEIEV